MRCDLGCRDPRLHRGVHIQPLEKQEGQRMTDSFKGFLMLLTVCVFLYILYRKRIKPLIQKRKAVPETVQPVQTAGSAARNDDESGAPYFDVIAFDVSGYAEVKDLENRVETEVTTRLDYINRKGKLLTMHYVGCGNVLFVLSIWQA